MSRFEEHVERFFSLHPELDNEVNRRVVEEVNRRIDQFAHYPNSTIYEHRKFLHHAEGIEYFQADYGEIGGLAALNHILDDCDGRVPVMIDYLPSSTMSDYLQKQRKYIYQLENKIRKLEMGDKV